MSQFAEVATVQKVRDTLRVLLLNDSPDHVHGRARDAGFQIDVASSDLAGMAALTGGDYDLCEPRLVGVGQPLATVIRERLTKLFRRLEDRAVPHLYRVILEEVERGVFSAALERSNGEVSAAAKMLGLNRNTLARKAKALGLAIRPRGRPARR